MWRTHSRKTEAGGGGRVLCGLALLGLLAGIAPACDGGSDSAAPVNGDLAGAGMSTAGSTPPTAEAGSPAFAAAGSAGGEQPPPAGTPGAAGSSSVAGSSSLRDAGTQPAMGDAAMRVDGSMLIDGSTEPPPQACDPTHRGEDPRVIDHDPLGAPTGVHEVVIEHDPGLDTHTVYRPAELGVGGPTHPVVVWANGGCITDGLMFSKALAEWASHGVIIISDGEPDGSGSGPLGTNGEPQRVALDWIVAENERPCSQYYRKVRVERIAAMGQSCGGLMTFGVSADPRLDTIVIWNSGMFQRDQEIYAGLHTPIGFFIGGSSDVAYPQAEADFAAIEGLPVFYGNLDVGHAATWGEPNGGEFARVGLHWLRWHLFDDNGPDGEQMFVGADCGLCATDWDIRKKNMD